MLSYKKLMMAAITGMVLATGCTKEDDDDLVVLEPIVLDCNFFQTDQVLEDDPNRPVDFIVPCVASVGGDIVIKAGVVIEFEDDAGLRVNNGSLKVEGTASDKVVFTGVNKVKGSWRGIFYNNDAINNQLDHAVVSYAGGNSFNSNNDRGSVICYTCKVSITNTRIDNGKEHGFNAVYSSTDIRDFSNNVITDNDKYPVYSLFAYAHMFDASNDFTGNGTDYVFLQSKGANFGGNHTWENGSVPYYVNGTLTINDDQSLTIEAGTEVRFDDEGAFWVRSGAYLAINGTEGNLVKLIGLVEQPGSWKGIINYSGDQRNVINYTEIAYAGGGSHNSNGDVGTIIVWSSAYQAVTNSILRDNAANAPCAINAPYNNETLVLTNNTYTNIANEECQ